MRKKRKRVSTAKKLEEYCVWIDAQSQEMNWRQEVPKKNASAIYVDDSDWEQIQAAPAPKTSAIVECRAWYGAKMKKLRVGSVDYWYRPPMMCAQWECEMAMQFHKRQAQALADFEKQEEERLRSNREAARERAWAVREKRLRIGGVYYGF